MQRSGERRGQEFDEPVVDDVQCGHPAADDPVLTAEVEGRDRPGRLWRLGRRLHRARVDALQQRVDFVLVEDLFAHCTTNSVK